MEIWSAVLDKIRSKIGRPSFETWLAHTEAEIEDDVIIVKALNEFAADWLEERYKSLIFETVREVTGETYEIEFINPNRFYRKKMLTNADYSDSDISIIREWQRLYHEQNEMLKKQQRKIEELEKRIQNLEQAEYVVLKKVNSDNKSDGKTSSAKLSFKKKKKHGR